MFYTKPPTPRYAITWNVDTVLKYLKTLHPVSKLLIKSLTLKLAALLALASAQRAQTLVSLDTAFMSITPDSVKFVVSSILKTSKSNNNSVQVVFTRFPPCDSLCVYLTFCEYLQRTKTSREAAETTKLLLSYIKPFQPISSDTCARWLRTVLSLSGVDVSIIKAHSFRSPSSSKAVSMGISIDLVLKSADWSNANTFTQFYRRDVLPIQRSFSDILQETLF